MELNMDELAEYICSKMGGLVSKDTILDILDLESQYMEENGFFDAPDAFENLLGEE